jgi:proline dehydrogenase
MLRSLLIRMSESKGLEHLVTSTGPTRRMAQRFVPGASLEDALVGAREVNRTGHLVSLDLLGENVVDGDGARRAAAAYMEVFDRIAEEKLDANVSLKLTQLGLDLDANLCEQLLTEIVDRAGSFQNFVRVDMEGSPYTQRTIDMVKRVRVKGGSVGTVMQAYLYRTEQDVRDLIAAACRIRLCKGAYKEPPEIAYPKKSDVDDNYIKLMKILLPSGLYHGIATHDPHMIAATRQFAAEQGIGADQFEFQMLYGIRTDLQQMLVKEGYRVRVYIPFGADWFPYFMRRLAERPANLMFFVRSLISRS